MLTTAPTRSVAPASHHPPGCHNWEITNGAATFKYKTEFSRNAKQNLLFGTTIKRNEYTNSENIDGIELGSFKNFPSEKIDGTIDVSGNTKISSFEGITQIIGGDLLLSECREITNLEFFPKQIDGNLDLSNCKKLTELGKHFRRLAERQKL